MQFPSLPLAVFLALPLACVTSDLSSSPPDLRSERAGDFGKAKPADAGQEPAKPGEQRLLKIIGHADRPTAAAFFNGASRLLTGSSDATLRTWDATSGGELARFKGHRLPVVAVAASADGRVVASSARDLEMRLWDGGNGNELRRLPGMPRALALSPDGASVAAGFDDHTVRVFATDTGVPRGSFSGHQRSVVRVAYSPGGDLLASADESGTVISWNLTTGEPLARSQPLGAAVRGMAFDGAGARLVVTTADRKAFLLDAGTLASSPAVALEAEAGVAAFTKAGDYVLIAGGTRLPEPDPSKEDYAVRMYAVANGRLTAVFAGHRAPVLAMAQGSADGEALITAGADETIRYWPSPATLAARTALNH